MLWSACNLLIADHGRTRNGRAAQGLGVTAGTRGTAAAEEPASAAVAALAPDCVVRQSGDIATAATCAAEAKQRSAGATLPAVVAHDRGDGRAIHRVVDGSSVAADPAVADQPGVAARAAVLARAAITEQEPGIAAVTGRASAIISGVEAVADERAAGTDQVERVERFEVACKVGRGANAAAED